MLNKGDFFTVKRWENQDKSYIGDCLEVVAISGSFIRAKRHPEGRLITLCADDFYPEMLSREFVDTCIKEG